MTDPWHGPVLLTGSTGLLGSTFARVLAAAAPICPDRAALDVADPRRVIQLVADIAPKIVINCAADVRADAAEADPDPAFRANAMLPSLLATACRKVGALLVQFSSTGCYGDWKATPYDEEDEPRPTTVHHRSKLAGERMIAATGCEALILRTGWLFGGDPGQQRNFVWRRLEEAVGQPRLRSDATQRGNPTFVDDLVAQTKALVEAGLRGTYNAVGGGVVTRSEYVARIVALAGLPCVVDPVHEPFERAAPVSSNEGAVNHRLRLLGMDRMRPWDQALADYVETECAKPGWGALKEKQDG